MAPPASPPAPASRRRVAFLACLGAMFLASGARAQTPPDFTVAFLGDQGLGPSAVAVLELIAAEGADAVVHSGDFEYADNPQAWEAQINAVLGPSFPYFASIGNHDTQRFRGSGGYQELLKARLDRLGIHWNGDLGVSSCLEYGGILFLLTGPGTEGANHDSYIRAVLASSSRPWRLSSWHKNQHLMQVEAKGDETGWGVYEESRRGGAIIVTAHAHTYSRTHLLSHMQTQTIASLSDTLQVRADAPASPADEGASFVVVSGLGGHSIRSQLLQGNWWASVYTATQNATYGALFGVFSYGGDPSLAHFYFKNIAGAIIDDFYVRTNVIQTAVGVDPAAGRSELSMHLVSPHPARDRLSLLYELPEAAPVDLVVYDVTGRVVHRAFFGRFHPAGRHLWEWEIEPSLPSGVYTCRIHVPGDARMARAVVLR